MALGHRGERTNRRGSLGRAAAIATTLACVATTASFGCRARVDPASAQESPRTESEGFNTPDGGWPANANDLVGYCQLGNLVPANGANITYLQCPDGGGGGGAASACPLPATAPGSCPQGAQTWTSCCNSFGGNFLGGPGTCNIQLVQNGVGPYDVCSSLAHELTHCAQQRATCNYCNGGQTNYVASCASCYNCLTNVCANMMEAGGWATGCNWGGANDFECTTASCLCSEANGYPLVPPLTGVPAVCGSAFNYPSWYTPTWLGTCYSAGAGAGTNLCPTDGGACFVAGTAVTMADGSSKRIETIEVGDRVRSFDPSTHRVGVGTVEKTFVHPHTPRLVRLNDTLWTTPEHRFYVDGAWRAARDLAPGDPLLVLSDVEPLSSTGARDAVESLAEFGADETTYNLEVVPFHDYFVGGILVHNAKAPQ